VNIIVVSLDVEQILTALLRKLASTDSVRTLVDSLESVDEMRSALPSITQQSVLVPLNSEEIPIPFALKLHLSVSKTLTVFLDTFVRMDSAQEAVDMTITALKMMLASTEFVKILALSSTHVDPTLNVLPSNTDLNVNVLQTTSEIRMFVVIQLQTTSVRQMLPVHLGKFASPTVVSPDVEVTATVPLRKPASTKFAKIHATSMEPAVLMPFASLSIMIESVPAFPSTPVIQSTFVNESNNLPSVLPIRIVS